MSHTLAIPTPLLPLTISLASLLSFTSAFPSPPSYVALIPLFQTHLNLPETTLNLLTTLSSSPIALLLHLTCSLNLTGGPASYVGAWVQVCTRFVTHSNHNGSLNTVVKGMAPEAWTDVAAVKRLHDLVAMIFAAPTPLPSTTTSLNTSVYTSYLTSLLNVSTELPPTTTLPFPSTPQQSYCNLSHSVIYHSPTQTPSYTPPLAVTITNTTNSVFHILHPLTHLTLINCRNVEVICPYTQVLAVDDAKGCSVSATCGMGVVKGCQDLQLFTKTNSPIVIHATPATTGMKVGPFNSTWTGISIPSSITAAPPPTPLFTVFPPTIDTDLRDVAPMCTMMVPQEFSITLPPHDIPGNGGNVVLNAINNIPIPLPRAYYERVVKMVEGCEGEEGKVKKEVARNWEVSVMVNLKGE